MTREEIFDMSWRQKLLLPQEDVGRTGAAVCRFYGGPIHDASMIFMRMAANSKLIAPGAVLVTLKVQLKIL